MDNTISKRKYVNDKLFGVIEVGYSASINTPNYILEEDKSNNSIQITAPQDDGISGLCILTQNESYQIHFIDLNFYWVVSV